MPIRSRKVLGTALRGAKFAVGSVSALRRVARTARWSSFGKYATNARWLASQVMWLKRMVNVEIKKYDANVAEGTALDSNPGLVYPLHEMAQGDTDQTRSGNSIKPLSVLIRGRLTNNATAVNTLVRVLLVLDTQQIADTTPSVSDILDPSYQFWNAPLNNNTVGRFKVLSDRKYQLTTVSTPIREFKIYQKLYGHIRYNGANSTDIQKGGIYLMFISDQATNKPTFGFQTRLAFTDN